MISRFVKSTIKLSNEFQTRNIFKVSSVFSRKFSNLNDEFTTAKDKLNKLKEEPGNEIKLKIYALFKQSTEGKCNKPKPGMMDFVGKAKWDAWNSLGEISKDDAMKQYIDLINGLAKEESSDTTASTTSTTQTGLKSDDIKIIRDNGVLTFKLNRPSKKNAITWEMYEFLERSLNEADKDPSVKAVVITGSGEYFCSGNDLSNFTRHLDKMTPQEMSAIAKDVLRVYVGCFINFSKPLIAAVNGPAIGISVTTLGLYDAVYASDNATFHTPFTVLGQSPEGCSSYTFPLIFGPMKAREMLLFNKKLSANEALGLVTEVIPHKVFHEEVKKRVDHIASLPPQSMKYSKAMIRNEEEKEKLHRINVMECNRLEERWISDECMNAITKFLSKK